MAKRTKKPERPSVEPCPCETPGCAGTLIPIGERGEPISLEYEEADKWRCSRGGGPGCGFAVDARDENGSRVGCPDCGGRLVFDNTVVGTTCGGLRLRGWEKCQHCGGCWVSRRGVPDAGGGTDGRWRLAAGGRSLDAGGLRVRAEGKGGDVPQLMARLSRMPAFEAALELLASGKGVESLEHAMRIAADALAIGDGADEVEA